MTEPLPSLAEALRDEALEFEEIEATTTPGGFEWRRGGELFALLDDDAATYRLAPLVAAAALRTPGTSPSPRGPGWITFRPAPVDGHALDRAIAWLASAWRHAATER